ncbi:MAG: acyloxyacyl hydrolase [Flavobacteriaceae bacterium]|nr:acyloxyacyl hydrolase [Flavobacteriaceae bacterium]
MELREEYTKYRSFNEYALNFGLSIRYELVSFADAYFIGSIGPMISGIDTERLKKGFAFSDIIGFGILFKIKKTHIDSRITFRHDSNAGLGSPKSGHNSAGLELGISYQL